MPVAVPDVAEHVGVVPGAGQQEAGEVADGEDDLQTHVDGQVLEGKAGLLELLLAAADLMRHHGHVLDVEEECHAEDGVGGGVGGDGAQVDRHEEWGGDGDQTAGNRLHGVVISSRRLLGQRRQSLGGDRINWIQTLQNKLLVSVK